MKGLAILVLVSFAVAEPPYPPSGWKPSGERLRLPVRNLRLQAPVPHAVYGPPTTEAPVETIDSQYGAPANPDDQYGAPAPDSGYGAPQQPDAGYGAPQQPDSGYGAPQQPDSGYGAPQQLNTEYGAPQQPANEYGAPPPQPDAGYGPPQQPDSGYGAPQQPDSGYGSPQQPDSGYGAPQQPAYEIPQEGSNLPVDPGASERLRQSQFIQQLPNYQSARFTAQNRPLRQQALQAQRLPTLQRTQMFRRPPQQSQNFRTQFQRSRL